jgi:alanine racemase
VVEAIINLAALRHNVAVVRKLAPESSMLAVIKANAYGHGMQEIASALAGSVDGFAVARVTEALSLRDSGIAQRLLIMSSRPSLEELETCAIHGLELVVHDSQTAGLIARSALRNKLRIWLKIDTGMHRLGIAPADAAAVFWQLISAQSVADVTLMSHFASADDTQANTTTQQLDCFTRTTAGLDAPRSIANSAAIITRPDAHYNWVRPGIMLYGANPLSEESAPLLQPVMTLCSRLLAVRDIGFGEGVGYNHIWTSDKATRIGTIGAGYGDGYPRHAANGTPVLVNGKRVPLVGRVSMDSITVDLGDHPEARPGDSAVLWGEGLPVNEVAACAGTISYELLTRVTGRVNYRYCESLAEVSADELSDGEK